MYGVLLEKSIVLESNAGFLSASWRTRVQLSSSLLQKGSVFPGLSFFTFSMFTVYALFSPSHNKIYIGFTSDIDNRMRSHNEFAKKGFSAKYRPWEIVFTETFNAKSEAMEREKQLKSARGRVFVWSAVREKYST